MTFKYAEVELRTPLFLWNENSNALIVYFFKNQISVRQLCVQVYLQESASLLLGLYSINTVTTGQALFKKKKEKNLHRQQRPNRR